MLRSPRCAGTPLEVRPQRRRTAGCRRVLADARYKIRDHDGHPNLCCHSPMIADARKSGTRWDRIGELLGVSANAAREQFG